LESALTKHSKVLSWRRIDVQQTDNHYIYFISRSDDLPDITIHLSDDYHYALDDYFQKHENIKNGSFICIARPEAKYDEAIVEAAIQDHVSIGKFGALMGALYKERHWEFVPKERRDEN
jgi:hypothetical protein